MIYGSLKEPTLSNWSRITHVSVGSAALVSALFAATGYATFTGYTQGKASYLQTQKNSNINICYTPLILYTSDLRYIILHKV